jgi:serine/threonine protein kinase
MENIDAPPLAQYPCNTLTATGMARILYDISSALYYMHRSGFAHNDIKPANILFSPARGAVLIDFGLSTELSDNSVHTGGTPWYVPPEFMEGGKRGAPGDVFALGVVMLYVVGKLPLPERHAPKLQWRIAEARIHQSEAQNKMESWQKVVEKAVDDLDVTSKLEAAVKEMVSPEPYERISLEILLEGLSTFR